MLAADIAGGSFPAVINILLALRARDQSGQGCHIDIAMTDAMFTFGWYGVMALGHATGQFVKPGEMWLVGGSPRYQIYPTKDGKLVACGAIEQKFWDLFTAAIKLPADYVDDTRAPSATRDAIAKIMVSKTSDEWRPILARADCCATIIEPLEYAMRDPHFVERGLFAHGVESQSAALCRRCRCRSRRSFVRSPAGKKRQSSLSLRRFAAHQSPVQRRQARSLRHHGRRMARCGDEIKPEATRALQRQKIGQQRAVEQVDRQPAAADIGAA